MVAKLQDAANQKRKQTPTAQKTDGEEAADDAAAKVTLITLITPTPYNPSKPSENPNNPNNNAGGRW